MRSIGWRNAGRGLGGATLAVLATLALIFLPITDWLTRLLEAVRGAGVWGPIIWSAIWIPACLLAIPGSLLTIGAGFAFGVPAGVACVSVGSVAGASTAFLVARFLARDWVTAKVARNPRLRAIDAAVAREGFKIVLLTRLSPAFPFILLNYFYGLTRVRFRDFALASWIGMLPGTTMFVFIGSGVQSLTEAMGAGGRTKTPMEYALFGVGLLATVAVTVVVTRIARKALDEAVPPAAPAEPAPAADESAAASGPLKPAGPAADEDDGTPRTRARAEP